MTFLFITIFFWTSYNKYCFLNDGCVYFTVKTKSRSCQTAKHCKSFEANKCHSQRWREGLWNNTKNDKNSVERTCTYVSFCNNAYTQTHFDQNTFITIGEQNFIFLFDCLVILARIGQKQLIRRQIANILNVWHFFDCQFHLKDRETILSYCYPKLGTKCLHFSSTRVSWIPMCCIVLLKQWIWLFSMIFEHIIEGID